MIRRLFTFASVVSLLLCAATAVLWVRSMRHNDSFVFMHDNGLWELASHGGRLWLDNQPERDLSLEPRRIILRDLEDMNANPRRQPQLISEMLQLIEQERERSIYSVVAPLSSRSFSLGTLVGILALLPAFLIVRVIVRLRVRAVRRRGDKCLSCGYDLRATPDRCPECGRVPEKARASG